LALAAAKATLETMIDLDAPALAHEASEQLRAGLLDLPGVTGVRGRGLILGAELNADIAKEVTQEALAAGVVVNAVRPNVIRCMPPLTVSADEIHEALRRLHAAMTKVHEQAGGE
jgi:acetylornithine aminotransferase